MAFARDEGDELIKVVVEREDEAQDFGDLANEAESLLLDKGKKMKSNYAIENPGGCRSFEEGWRAQRLSKGRSAMSFSASPKPSSGRSPSFEQQQRPSSSSAPQTPELARRESAKVLLKAATTPPTAHRVTSFEEQKLGSASPKIKRRTGIKVVTAPVVPSPPAAAAAAAQPQPRQRRSEVVKPYVRESTYVSNEGGLGPETDSPLPPERQRRSEIAKPYVREGSYIAKAGGDEGES